MPRWEVVKGAVGNCQGVLSDPSCQGGGEVCESTLLGSLFQEGSCQQTYSCQRGKCFALVYVMKFWVMDPVAPLPGPGTCFSYQKRHFSNTNIHTWSKRRERWAACNVHDDGGGGGVSEVRNVPIRRRSQAIMHGIGTLPNHWAMPTNCTVNE